jgi:hypothetical protein
MEFRTESKAAYDEALKTVARSFYDNPTIIMVDFLCHYGGMDEFQIRKKLKFHQKMVRSSIE